MRRRELLKCAGALALAAQPLIARLARAAQMPSEVAGVALPRSPLAQSAAAFARASCPDYLFNHCMRTFVFGTLLLGGDRRLYRADDAFVAASFHDLGLMPAFATPRNPFEIDGANAAESWLRERGASVARAGAVWFAVELHDNYRALARRVGGESLLVCLGAGADVVGPEPGTLDERQIGEVIAAFPRLGFKRRFTELLVAHCLRKPDSQDRTWLEPLCRAHGAHTPPQDAVERQIAAAPFTE